MNARLVNMFNNQGLATRRQTVDRMYNRFSKVIEEGALRGKDFVILKSWESSIVVSQVVKKITEGYNLKAYLTSSKDPKKEGLEQITYIIPLTQEQLVKWEKLTKPWWKFW